MEVDADGNLAVVGSGLRNLDGVTVGLFWQTAPYAAIVQQPVPDTVSLGQQAAFNVVARGNGGLSYQWRRNGAALTDDARITGSHSAQLRIAPAQLADRGLYDVQVSNPLRTVFSQAESLTVLGVVGVGATPAITRLAGISPLPVSRIATIRFQLARRSQASLRVYDLSGRLVRSLANEVMPAGEHHLDWDTRGFMGGASGVYFLRFEADEVSETRKVLVLR
jgi:hypothetical protein